MTSHHVTTRQMRSNPHKFQIPDTHMPYRIAAAAYPYLPREQQQRHKMPCAAGELCLLRNLTPKAPDGHQCRGGCCGRLHVICGDVEEDGKSELNRICPACVSSEQASTAAAGKQNAVLNVCLMGQLIASFVCRVFFCSYVQTTQLPKRGWRCVV